jgi:hypothetical protein
MVDAMKYEEFLDYVEDLEDTVAILEHRLNPGDPSDWKPFEQVVAELGLDNLADEEV